jgi:hypothetical protein
VADPSIPASAIQEAVHLRYITLRSGWEWQLPRQDGRDQPGAVHQPGSVPHSHEIAFDLLRRGAVRVQELITHRYPPADCQTAFEGAVDRKAEGLGVLFDWE